jgi:nicotinamidase-related amidase
MEFSKSDTALVVIDPQNDVLSEAGVSWGLAGESIRENNTVENLDRLFRAAKQVGYEVFISPHYLCVESHLRELIEQGFEVAVVKDATAAPRHPELGDGYKAAVVNYNFIANAVLTTNDAVSAMR